MRTWAFIGMSVVSLAMAGRAGAAVNNGSFELAAGNPVLPENRITVTESTATGALTGWEVTQGSVDLIPSNRWAAQEGTWSLDLIGTSGLGRISTVVDTVEGTTYKLSFFLSANFEKPSEPATKRMRVSVDGSGEAIELEETLEIDVGTRSKTAMNYLAHEFTIVATSSATTIIFEALAPQGMGLDQANNLVTGAVIDNIRFDVVEGPNPPSGGVVPEPASLGILGMGGMMLLRRRSRRA